MKLLTLVGLLLAITGFVRAQELTVHDGGATNGYVPVYGFYADAYLKCEYIIPAADLVEMAAYNIDSITYYLATPATTNWGTAYFQVFMKEVSSTTIDEYQGMDGATLVYEGSLDGTQTEMIIPFSDSYFYNGGNLLIGIYNVEQGNYKSCSFYGETVDGASVQGYSYNSLDEVACTQRNFIPKTTFYYSGGVQGAILVTTPDPIDLGYRPNGAWMRPLEVNIFNLGTETTINSVAITNNSYFQLGLENISVPFTLGHYHGFNVNLGSVGSTSGVVNGNLVVNYGDNEVTLFDVSATAYTPVSPDVWEHAQLVSSFPFTATLNANSVPLYDNYRLPPASISDGADAVYKLVFTEDTYLNASVTSGENGKVALYTEDFNGVGGPDFGNSYTRPQIGGDNAPFTAMIGEGTSTFGYFPFYTLYNYSIAENLFLASELEAAGVTTAPMTSLSWYATNTTGYFQQGITIWMANVNDETLTATSHVVTDMTKVYTGAMTPEIGWNEFVFNEGIFAWDGYSNILIYCQRNNGEWNSTVYWQATPSMPFNASSYKYQDTGAYDPTIANSMYTSTTRPNIIFKSGNNGRNRDSFVYDFETDLQGWTNIDNDGDGYGWIVATDMYTGTEGYGANGSDNFAISHSYIDNVGTLDCDNYLVSPQAYALGNGASLSFYHDLFSNNYLDYMEVCIATAAVPTATDFTPIWNNSGSRRGNGQHRNEESGFNRLENWALQTLDLSAYAGQNVWIAFHHQAYNQYGVLVDDVTINSSGSGSNGTISNLTVTPGTYYLVASSTSNQFTVEINTDEVPCPELANNPSPADAAMEVNTSVLLSWNLDSRATEYRLMFGTSYYCEDTLVDWTDELSERFFVTGLNNNTNYFWRIDQRNDGCPEGVLGQVWGFTTHLNVPLNLYADNYIHQGEDLPLYWNAPNDRSLLYYNIYQDNELIGSTYDTYYTVSGLPYNIYPGYYFNVTAVYDQGESNFSNTRLVRVTGEGTVEGYVYEQDGVTPIQGARVEFQGTGQVGGTYSYYSNTDENGYYSFNMIAGTYTGTATCAGYQEAQHGSFTIAYNELTSDINFVMDELFNPVNEVVAEYYPDAENPESPYVKVHWGTNTNDWLYYDDGIYVTSIGTGGGLIYWASMFPTSSIAPYIGTSLTKVALYENEYNTDEVTVLIYLGGDNAPQTLVSAMSYYPVGGNAFHEVTLTSPVYIEGNQNIWIVFSENGTYPANACTDTGEANNRWVSLDGTDWMDVASAGVPGYGWMIRGFVSNSSGRGETIMTNNLVNSNQQPANMAIIPRVGSSNGIFSAVSNVTPHNVGTPAAIDMEGFNRSFQYYRVYRTNAYNYGPYTLENTELLASGIQDTLYIDVSWPNVATGVYKWGVSCVYEGNRGEEIEGPISWGEPMVINENCRVFEGTRAPGNNYKPVSGTEAIADYTPNRGNVTVILTAGDVWGDNSGYQMLFDANATAFGNVIPETGPLSTNCSGNEAIYAEFEYMIPQNADGNCSTQNIVFNNSVGIQIPAGTYDWCITNPVSNDRIWIAASTGNVGGREDDYVFEEGNIYEFVLSMHGSNDGVDVFITDDPNYILQVPRESAIVWSNFLGKDMYLNNGEVDISVTLNSGDSPAGTTVRFTNLNAGEQQFYPIADVILDGTGYYVWDNFRKGDYQVTITKDGYETIIDNIGIWDATSLSYIMTEIIYNVSELYVSRTGWAKWNAQGYPSTPDPQPGTDYIFSENFDNGIPNGWTTIDADGDGYTWVSSMTPGNYHNAGVDLTGTGHNASTAYVISGSYANGTGMALTPDNYLVSPQVTLAAGSTFSFWACAQDASYAADHFGVFISDNGTSNWTMVQEWTMTAKSGGDMMSIGRGGKTRAQGNWYYYTVDLSAYAGQKHIAIRHFNCSDQFILNVDDIELTSGAKGGDRHLEYYNVICENINHETIFNVNTPYNFCQVATDGLVEGEQYICKVAAVYSTGTSTYKECTWEYEPCDHWGPVDNVVVYTNDQGNRIEWMFENGYNPYGSNKSSIGSDTQSNDVWNDGSSNQVLQRGGEFYTQYAEDGIMLNFYALDNVDLRAFLLYNLSNDSRFSLVPEDEYGQFVLTSNGAYNNFMDEFEMAYQKAIADFSLLSKVDIADSMVIWKSSVVPTNYLSIMMDVITAKTRTENDHCLNSIPFCTSDVVEFESAYSGVNANENASFGCLYTTPNPSWYHMRIHAAGQFVIHMEGHDPDDPSTLRDIDYCVWGPFTNPYMPCINDLTTDKIIDCNYSAHYAEDVFMGYPEDEHQHQVGHGTVNYHMPEIGEYYIMMITNYSNQPCNITFTKTQGVGETDCDIINTTGIIGFLITEDDEFVAIAGPDDRDYTVEGEFGEHEYCVRPIYPGEMQLPTQNYGWSMGCPQTASIDEENHWNVDIHQYPYNMNVTGIIQINGVEQQTPTLEIGAFCGDECRGTQRLTYFPQVDRYLVFLTLYGDAGDVMRFRLYDHALGQEVDLSCSSTITFVPDGFMGTAFDPYVFSFGNTMAEQVSNFSQGYNWWGTYIEQEGIDGLGMLQNGLGDNGVTIRSQASGYTDYYQGYGWYGSLSSINNESSYRVITSAPCTVTMTGNAAVPSQHPITLSQGWTWIGYVPSTTMSVDAAFANLDAVQGDKLKSQQGYADYYADYGWFGSLSTIEPNMGLMYYSMNGNPVTFTYPDNGRGGELRQNLTAENNHWVPNVYAYPDNMTVMAVVELNNEELSNENYELAAFSANGECRGSIRLAFAEPLNRHVAFLTISGSEATDLSFRLYNTETNVEYYDAEESLDFVANAIVGTADNLYTIHFRGAAVMDEFANMVRVYPNPVNRGERVSIGMNAESKMPVRVEIVNALGAVVSVETSTQAPASIVAPVTAGVYTLRIIVEGKGTAVRKLVVK